MMMDFDTLLPPLIFGTVIVAFAGFCYYAWVVEKRRTERLSELANDLGFEFTASSDEECIGGFGELHLFSRGDSKKFYNLMRGETPDLSLVIFDYRYSTGSGKNRSTYNKSVLCFLLRDQELPRFQLRREHFFDKIGNWLGFSDINFDDYPEFSDRYMLKGSDEWAIRELFTREVLEHFESIDKKSAPCVEACGSRLILYRENKRCEPDEIRDLMQEGFEILRLFHSRKPQGA